MTPQEKDKTIRYLMGQIEDLLYWDEIRKDALLQSLVIDAEQTLNKLRLELQN